MPGLPTPPANSPCEPAAGRAWRRSRAVRRLWLPAVDRVPRAHGKRGRAAFGPLVVLPVAGAIGLVVTGCEKPTPLVSVQSGDNFVTTNAAQYVREGTTVESDITPPVLEASPGASVNIDVPAAVADEGYFLSANNQRITDVIRKPHYRLTLPTQTGSFGLVVFQAPAGEGEGGTATGSWPFQVTIKP